MAGYSSVKACRCRICVSAVVYSVSLLYCKAKKMYFAAILIYAAFLGYTSGLQCMTCSSSSSTFECDTTGELKVCLPNEKSCETVVRRNHNNYIVKKGCKQTRACLNNQLQNDRYSGSSTQCNGDQRNSFCTCCCHDNGCNRGDVPCVKYPGVCPPQPKVIPNGNVKCSNEATSDARCEYECTTPEFALHPNGQDSNSCQENGTWQYSTPCCARPCPPYILFDSVILLHGAYPEETGPARTQVFLDFFANVNVGENAAKLAAMAYSGILHTESIVRYDEYNNDKTIMTEMILERLQVNNTADGEIKTGLAIRYAVDNLFVPEVGARGADVPKAITIALDNNPTDDAVEAAKEARARGIETHVYGFRPPVGELNVELLEEIAGNPKHVFIFDGDASKLTGDYLADVTLHFCQNPCNYVRSKV